MPSLPSVAVILESLHSRAPAHRWPHAEGVFGNNDPLCDLFGDGEYCDSLEGRPLEGVTIDSGPGGGPAVGTVVQDGSPKLYPDLPPPPAPAAVLADPKAPERSLAAGNKPIPAGSSGAGGFFGGLLAPVAQGIGQALGGGPAPSVVAQAVGEALVPSGQTPAAAGAAVLGASVLKQALGATDAAVADVCAFVRDQAYRTQATAEHRALMSEREFRQYVVRVLARILQMVQGRRGGLAATGDGIVPSLDELPTQDAQLFTLAPRRF